MGTHFLKRIPLPLKPAMPRKRYNVTFSTAAHIPGVWSQLCVFIPRCFDAETFGIFLSYKNLNKEICNVTFSRNSCSSWWVFVTVVTERSDQFT